MACQSKIEPVYLCDDVPGSPSALHNYVSYDEISYLYNAEQKSLQFGLKGLSQAYLLATVPVSYIDSDRSQVQIDPSSTIQVTFGLFNLVCQQTEERFSWWPVNTLPVQLPCISDISVLLDKTIDENRQYWQSTYQVVASDFESELRISSSLDSGYFSLEDPSNMSVVGLTEDEYVYLTDFAVGRPLHYFFIPEGRYNATFIVYELKEYESEGKINQCYQKRRYVSTLDIPTEVYGLE